MITDIGIAVLAAIISAIAAVVSAIISAMISISISKRAASQKIAEMRQAWIDDLRSHLAELVGVVHRILNESDSSSSEGSKRKRLEELNADLMRLESYISMKLNHDEVASKRLVNVMGQTRGAAAHASHAPTGYLTNRIHSHLQEIDALSRLIFKSEWDRVKDEMKPVSRRAHRQRSEALQRRLKDIPDTNALYVNTLITNTKE